MYSFTRCKLLQSCAFRAAPPRTSFARRATETEHYFWIYIGHWPTLFNSGKSNEAKEQRKMAAAGSTSRLTGQSHETIIHLSSKSETPAFHTASTAPLCNAGGELHRGLTQINALKQLHTTDLTSARRWETASCISPQRHKKIILIFKLFIARFCGNEEWRLLNNKPPKLLRCWYKSELNCPVNCDQLFSPKK